MLLAVTMRHMPNIEKDSGMWNNLVAIARMNKRNGGKLIIIMDAKSQLWQTTAMDKLCDEFGMLVKLADMCQVGMTDQNHLTDAKVAFTTNDPYLEGRLETLKCDNTHPHLRAAGRDKVLYPGENAKLMEIISTSWWRMRANSEFSFGTPVTLDRQGGTVPGMPCLGTRSPKPTHREREHPVDYLIRSLGMVAKVLTKAEIQADEQVQAAMERSSTRFRIVEPGISREYGQSTR